MAFSILYKLICSPYKRRPIIFVLSPGADPATDIFKLANILGMGGPKMKYMALGQGQGPVAQSMLWPHPF